MADDKCARHSLPEQMSKEELETIVREDCLSPGVYEASYIDAVLDELVARAEKDGSTRTEQELDQVWRKIQNRAKQIRDNETIRNIKEWTGNGSAHRKNGKGRGWLRASAVAAVLALFLLVMPVAEGKTTVYDIIANWTEDILLFSSRGTVPSVTEQSEALQYGSENEGLKNLREELHKYGVIERVVPGWIPAGFELINVDCQVFGDGAIIGSTFVRGEDHLIMNHRFGTTDYPLFVEKDDAEVRTYVVSGITHYIVSNIGRLQCVWQNGSVSCTLSGDVSEQELYKIIDSMYE